MLLSACMPGMCCSHAENMKGSQDFRYVLMCSAHARQFFLTTTTANNDSAVWGLTLVMCKMSIAYLLEIWNFYTIYSRSCYSVMTLLL